MPTETGRPLDIKPEPWKEFTRAQKQKFRAIAEWDLSFIAGEPLYRQGVSAKYLHKPAIEELRRFLAIKIMVNPKHMGMFGPVVVAAWHAFILNTMRYEEFCKKFHQKLIHHVPGGKPEDDTTVWLTVYHSWFGPLPPVWKVDINGLEIPGMEEKINVRLSADQDHLDSDDGAY